MNELSQWSDLIRKSGEQRTEQRALDTREKDLADGWSYVGTYTLYEQHTREVWTCMDETRNWLFVKYRDPATGALWGECENISLTKCKMIADCLRVNNIQKQIL